MSETSETTTHSGTKSASSDQATSHDGTFPKQGIAAQLETRLTHIETMLSRWDHLATQVPGLLAMMGDVSDEWGHKDGKLDERLRGILRLAERLSRPETLNMLNKAVDQLSTMPGIIATLGDILEQMVMEPESSKIDLHDATENALASFQALIRILARPETRALLETTASSGQAITHLHWLHQCMSEAQLSIPANTQVGIWGLLKAMRDPKIQRSLAFATEIAKSLEQKLHPALAPQNPPQVNKLNPAKDGKTT